MVRPTIGTVALVRFPFSDLSHSKVRPALVLADAGRGDWILCQITSNPYADARAIVLKLEDFVRGSLRQTSYARPGKLFTGHEQLIVGEGGVLDPATTSRIIRAVIDLLSANTIP